MHREQHREQVIGGTLREPIQRMERIARIRRGHDPPMMGLVQVLVNQGKMQASMNPVNQEVGEEHEEAELGVVVPAAGAVFGSVVELGVTANFEKENHACRDGNSRHGDEGLSDLLADLILEELGVLEGGFVEDEDIRERGEEEVVDESEEPRSTGR